MEEPRADAGKAETGELEAGVRGLGLAEANKRRRELRLRVITWNVGTAEPPEEADALLALDQEGPPPHLYIIGLQELSARVDLFLRDSLVDDPWSCFLMDVLAPRGYVRRESVRLQGLLLLVFVQNSLLPLVRDVHTAYTRTGLGGYWGNKGGVSVRMSLCGLSLCFVNCHLPPHEGGHLQRLDALERILDEQRYPAVAPAMTPMENDANGSGGDSGGRDAAGQDGNGDGLAILEHDVVLCLGDLNFRIADHGLRFTRDSIDNGRLHLLWGKDELNISKANEAFLRDFQEGPLSFPPTYKFDQGTNTYDTSGKRRKPAWTDRVLWRVKGDSHNAPGPEGEGRGAGANEDHGDGVAAPSPRVKLLSYTSHMDCNVSDHKPVTAEFLIQLEGEVDAEGPVSVEAIGEWSAARDAKLSLHVQPGFPTNPWDWIGLYAVGWRHPKDYVSYVWARDEELWSLCDDRLVRFDSELIPREGGEHVLAFYSRKHGIVGISRPFMVSTAPFSPPDSPPRTPTEDRSSWGNNF